MVQQRYVLCAVLFLSLGVTFTLRMIFTLILTQMVYIPNVDLNNSSYSSSNSNDGRYQWSQELQGIILSSFSWGNLFSQLPSGILVQKFGGKITFLISALSSAVVVAVIPLSVTYGDAGGLIVSQILIGLLQGPLIPAISSFSAGWIPIEERSRLISIIFMGINTFGMLSVYLVGIIIDSYGRWDIAFYGYAVITAMTATLFAVLCYENPQKHPFISNKEKEYLKMSTAAYLELERKIVPPTPWKAIFTSAPALALFATHDFYMWAFTIVNTNFPKYMNDVLHISLKKNSFYTSVPRFLNIFISIFAGFMGDWLHSKRKINLTIVRKIFAGLSSIIPAIFVVAASYAGFNELLVVTLLSIATASQGFNTAGTLCTAFELAPNYIGPINGIALTVSSVAESVAPYVVGVLTPNAYLTEWRLVFWITCVCFLAKAIIFTIWGTAKIQPWNSPNKRIPNA